MRLVAALSIIALGLVMCAEAARYNSTAQQGLDKDAAVLGEAQIAADKVKLAATPAYVISGIEERWQYTRQVLAALHITTTERVWPPKPSLHLATKMYATHNYDKHVNLSLPNHQKYFSLLLSFKRALHLIAHHPDLTPHDFAILTEDDISLHDTLSPAAARAAILHGFDLARSDGWLYLGICWPTCFNESLHTYQGHTYTKCGGDCTHAFGITKHRAASLMQDAHNTMEDFVARRGSFDVGHAIDQFLGEHAKSMRGVWAVATDLFSPIEAGQVGIFFQDKERFRSTIDPEAAVAKPG